MGTKRPHNDDSMPAEPASRRTSNHPSKRQKSQDFAPPAAKSASVNQLKSKIRDLTRALQHSDHLPAGVRIEKERALAGYKQDVAKISEDKRKNEFVKKYHMVRFFERQKATRALKKLQRRLDASPADTSEHDQLAKEVQDATVDVNYTIYHPLTEKYQSLFPRQQEGAGAEEKAARKLVKDKPAMWKVVEQCTADGTLGALREGNLETGIPTGKEKPRSKRKGKDDGAGSKSSKGAALKEQDEASDGGFFEE